MDDRLSIDLEVSRADGPARVVTLEAPVDASTGAALDVLATHLGLAGAAGAVQARSLLCGVWVDRATRLGDLGLLRGERLSLLVSTTPPAPPGALVRWHGTHAGDHRGRVAVPRPPRSVAPEPTLSVAVPVPRRTRPPRRFPLGAMLIPLLIGVVLVVATRRWEIALFSLFTPVMVVWNHVEERRAHRDEVAEYGRTYEEDVALALSRVSDLRADWAEWQHRHHPDPGEIESTVRLLGPRLWERQPGDPDFLNLRLGLSRRRAPVTLRQDDPGHGSPAPVVADLEAAAQAADVPAVVDLERAGLLALLGDRESASRVADWVTLQVAALHSPADVVIVAALADPGSAASWRWLPHVPDDWTSPGVVCDRPAAEALLEEVVARSGARREEADRRDRSRTLRQRVLVVVDDRLGIDAALLRRVAACHDVGVATVWVGEDPRAVPATASHTVDLGSGLDDAEIVAHRGAVRSDLAAEGCPPGLLRELAPLLAPARDASDQSRVRVVPDRVTLGQLVPGLTSPVEMRHRWEDADPLHLVARLGISAEGPVDLDLGPAGNHVLVGGTTGAGKSELLQTLVASLAAAYPPGRVGFLLVDYKGGAAFKDARNLPHCVGVVTDLDQRLTRRVLQALDAEVHRREELLARGGARDLSELRERSADTAPGELVIVVDEFATLAKEIPEFVEGVVDLAARGRSLGLRLVLATQRPAGVVSDRIRANVGVRIALRMNDEADSNDVIGDRAAAHVARTLPGRCYLRLHRELVELQSAFVGGPERRGTSATIEVGDVGRRSPEQPGRTATGRSELEAVVEASRRVVRLGGWPAAHVPWLPALPSVVTLEGLRSRVPATRGGPPGRALLGLADLPRRQSQRVVELDLERHQGLLVFGTSRSGKTTLLRTLAAELIDGAAPGQLEIFGLDFAGHGLHLLERAPHCPGVVGPSEPGRVARVLRRLSRAVEERSRLMASTGATGFADLARLVGPAPPRLVVLLDGYPGAVAALERLDGGRLLDRLLRLVPDGPAVGVHFVITADRRSAVPSALTSVMTTRLVLRMAERDDYALLGVDRDLLGGADPGPGRGVINGTTEVQVAVLESADGDEEQRALTDLIQRAVERWPSPAPPVGRMPAQVSADALPPPRAPLVLPLAVGDDEVVPVSLDLSVGHALVAGPPRSGRSTTLATLAESARRHPAPVSLVLVLGRPGSPLADLPWDVGPVVADDADDLGAALTTVEVLLAEGRPALLLCDDADCLSDAATNALESLTRRTRDAALRVVAAADNRWALRAYGGLVPELRRSKQAVLLAPDLELDGDLVGVRLPRPLEPIGAPGRGFLVTGGVPELVQVALPAPAHLPPDPHAPRVGTFNTRLATDAEGLP